MVLNKFFIVFGVEETFTNITGNKLLSYLSHLNYNSLIQCKVLTLQRANFSFFLIKKVKLSVNFNIRCFEKEEVDAVSKESFVTSF